MSTPIRLAFTMGDPAGIGPEIIAKATREMAALVQAGRAEFIVLGSAAAMAQAEATLGLPAAGADGRAFYRMVDVGPVDAPVVTGQVSAAGGEWAYRAVEKATRMVQAGEADAIVTGPLSKEALHLAGHHFEGHTELLAHLTGQRDAVMMLAHGDMRVTHVTTHCALADVPRRITPERLRRVFDVTLDAMRALGIEQPRVAVAGLNPHCGEGGILGTEDDRIIAPVIKEYTDRGQGLIGPVPGDTVFIKMRGRQFDAVVAMFHDQGHIPLKLLGFQVDPATGAWQAISGVNITLGLPILRTSVDHGTAFDIAGKGVANANSVVEAAEYALQLIAGRKAVAAAQPATAGAQS
ncbi:4-hydroxythreonine-4-phosphate dehydrogenase PdxA [Azohydromonas caseinilytica]|uniref:4-hydroxythreonine-4-phosphate dehydrogenase PdxA n=1 Tax=Azohydromonas caseinilytica TaxID=2728836 RepID=A0A848F800_9BURK|nr:4-hydroxythreonine-4-phosphate dehydrogenase PdxA [Azohydromonas caseinilytica]NML15694.1 4-hydroxythreonine-4-phosphate dehydrogenase PdxA [Azohydromonas caseinilytica]